MLSILLNTELLDAVKPPQKDVRPPVGVVDISGDDDDIQQSDEDKIKPHNRLNDDYTIDDDDDDDDLRSQIDQSRGPSTGPVVIYSSLFSQKSKKDNHPPFIQMDEFEIVDTPGTGTTHLPHYRYHPSTYDGAALMSSSSEDECFYDEERTEDRTTKRQKRRRKLIKTYRTNVGERIRLLRSSDDQEIRRLRSLNSSSSSSHRSSYIDDTSIRELMFAVQHLSFDIQQLRTTMSQLQKTVSHLSVKVGRLDYSRTEDEQ